MDRIKKIEALALLDNRFVLDGSCYDTVYVKDREDAVCVLMDFPDYLNSHDAIQRIIDNMDATTLTLYFNELWKLVTDAIAFSLKVSLKVMMATPEQKAEAILKVYNK